MSPMVAHNEKKTSQGKRRQSLREESRQKIKNYKENGGKIPFCFLRQDYEVLLCDLLGQNFEPLWKWIHLFALS